MPDWWQTVVGDSLAQGDYLRECQVPLLPEDYGEQPEVAVELVQGNLIIVT